MPQPFLKIERIHPNQSAFHRVREIPCFRYQVPALVNHLAHSMSQLNVGPVHPEPEFLQGKHEFVMGCP